MAAIPRSVRRIERELQSLLEMAATYSDPLIGPRFSAKISQLKAELREARLLDANRDTLKRIAAEMVDTDEARFWFRRFLLALGIANAAGFASLASGVMGAKDVTLLHEIAANAIPAMKMFAFGAVLAGLIPLALWLRANVPAIVTIISELLYGDIAGAVVAARTLMVWTAGVLAAASSGLFLMGVGAALQGVEALSKVEGLAK